MTEDVLYQKLLGASIRYVSFRPRSQKEMEAFLLGKLRKRKKPDAGEIKRVIQRLQEYGYVDDEKFASWWIEQRSVFRPKGMRALAAELRQKGISRKIIEDLLVRFSEPHGMEEGEEQIARRAVSKKIAKWALLPLIEQKKKVYTFLAQRGFSFSVIEKIVDEIVKKDYNRK